MRVERQHQRLRTQPALGYVPLDDLELAILWQLDSNQFNFAIGCVRVVERGLCDDIAHNHGAVIQ